MSKIFTKAELKEINRRLDGSKNDPTGIFYGRIKPKIKELLEIWIPKKSLLKKLIRKKIQKKY